MACGEISLWYNITSEGSRFNSAMACGEISLWYNERDAVPR